MQFKHPEILYALFLLLIPIIIHLFQLRKFQKEVFTNVAFLKKIEFQTRKSSKLKKWLTLITRMLLLTCLIFAFAQPFFSNNKLLNTKKETVIFLDNSFSMQAKGNHGELLKRAIQDLISNVPENEPITLVTNDNVYKNTTIKALKNDLLQLDYTANALSPEAAFLKAKTFFSKQKGILKQLILISDFQNASPSFNSQSDSLTKLYAVKLSAVNKNNITIDSAYVSARSELGTILNVVISKSGQTPSNLPISLYNADKLIAKTAINTNTENTTSFTLANNQLINGKIEIEDDGLQFDNSLYFSINETSKINVLAISDTDDIFLNRIYTDDTFNFKPSKLNQLNYNAIENQQLVILNGLNDIPTALIEVLKTYTNQGGYLLIIPSKSINLGAYNALLANFGLQILAATQTEKHITTINYEHPLYKNGVFEKQVKNFQYPKSNLVYGVTNEASKILQFEDASPFLLQSKQVYVFTSPLSLEFSNFKNSPLIVPTLFNMGKLSLKLPQLYYVIGNENTFDVETTLKKDAIINLTHGDINIIPKQQYFNNKVSISTFEMPNIANTYEVKTKFERFQNVSYNYNRKESNLATTVTQFDKNTEVSNSVTQLFDNIKYENKVNSLWKWFIILTLLFLIIEIAILKYFK